ncbi:ABC transporter permease [Rhabdobacter roseus]|uniref:Putative ABC transport system permease protein n=1 Tax=Rhabdobacter roseus TaxID=1655419 RepID=A0A840TP52_9BACT|nr:FtsX-like permease family protein [Rhabdobacter roseus]MBB5285134.1 putative ABC transport system permease protein [Rhabdobacter roseus]
MNPKDGLNFRWLLRMAWRDSRRNRSRMLLFVSSMVLGIAALVAIYALGDNLRQNIDEQAASLLGADLRLSGNRPASPALQKRLDSLANRRSEERSFASMIYFVRSGGSRLAQIRALAGEYPYYGELETTPAAAGSTFRTRQEALVDQTLMLQYEAQVGDSIKVGEVTFRIAGILQKAPGQTGLTSTVAPSVYIPMRYLEPTGLLQKGSRINYLYYLQFDRKVNLPALLKTLEPRLDAEDLNYSTVESQKESTGRSFRDLSRFLSLVGFIALLLGCIGVASAIHIYVREKLNSIAILRCLGVKASQAFLIYLIQITALGAIGALVGALLGTLLQQVLPVIIQDFLPITLTTGISWSAVGQGVGLGILISVLFALLPLLSIRAISPLYALRVSFESTRPRQGLAQWVVYVLIVLFVYGFTYLQVRSLAQAAFFTVGIGVAFLVLTGIGTLLMRLVRRFFPDGWSYVARQGLANLYRPNNQTTLLIVTIGLGTAFICTLFFVQTILLTRVTLSTSGHQPNLVLFDIQDSQKEAVRTLAQQYGLPTEQLVPIVNMRLEAVNGATAAVARQDSAVSRRIFGREYRVTYRDSLTASERVVEGTWVGTAPGPAGAVPVSLEEGFARRNRLKLGDTLTFNVQGAQVPTVIRSLREVDWNEVRTNFLVVFPQGVLEEAPQFHVLLTRVPSEAVSARFQRAMVQQFPNVSLIDLGLVLRVIDELLEKIGFVIRFMAGLSILTGLVVLVASVLISKYQRLQESVLLRTLGASRRQIFAITALEYFFLGSLAALTGILVALVSSWLLARYSFETTFTPALLPVLAVFGLVSLLTVVVGLVNSRGVLSRPPLEVLRQDT